MAGATLTVSDGEKVLIPVCDYESLVRDSERLEIVMNYLRTEKYATVGVIARILGVELVE